MVGSAFKLRLLRRVDEHLCGHRKRAGIHHYFDIIIGFFVAYGFIYILWGYRIPDKTTY